MDTADLGKIKAQQKEKADQARREISRFLFTGVDRLTTR